MKMQHVPIEATNPFAEAANGGQPVPGQGGVTGGGEAHDAWNRAVEQANVGLEDGAIAEGQETQTDGVVMTPVVGMGDQERTDKVSVSWDRLSMTVASMVAWNMQVEMADENPAAEMSLAIDAIEAAPTEIVSEISTPEPIEVLDGELDQYSQAELESPLAIALSQALTDGKMTIEGQGSSKTDADLGVDLSSGSSGSVADDLNISMALENGDLDSTTVMAQQLEEPSAVKEMVSQSLIGDTADVSKAMGSDAGIQSAATEPVSSDAGAIQAMNQSAMAGAADQANNLEKATSSLSVEQGIQTLAVSDEDSSVMTETKPMESAKTTVVQPKKVDTGLERLAGIREAIAELDAHVVRSSQTKPSADPTAELKGRLAEIEMTFRASREVMHNTNTSAMKTAPVQVAQDNIIKAEKPVNVSSDDGADLAAEDGDSPVLKRSADSGRATAKPEMASGIHRPGRVGQGAGTGSETTGQMTFSESAASITGSENSEISADVDRKIEFAEFDAANIDAGEVPELPVADMSQLDIDIEDPAGHVRLAMTKEAEEVVVRLQTPEEVVEEYREMEEEMGKQIAKRGLDLTDFSADAHTGDAEDEAAGLQAENESNQKAQTGVEAGETTLEETGDSARLVNRIV